MASGRPDKPKRKKARAKAAPAKRSVKFDAAKTIARLPNLGPQETVQVWLNALRVLDDPKRETDHAEAQKVLDGVETCWLIRSRGTPEGWFRWPSTTADGGDGSVDGSTWLKQGPLKVLGYEVGQNGEAKGVREGVLDRVFQGVLPPLFPPAYLRGWGEQSSPARLEKMADSIASFARYAKRRDDHAMGVAIRDWEDDLAYLYRKFYVGRFGFGWPAA